MATTVTTIDGAPISIRFVLRNFYLSYYATRLDPEMTQRFLRSAHISPLFDHFRRILSPTPFDSCTLARSCLFLRRITEFVLARIENPQFTLPFLEHSSQQRYLQYSAFLSHSRCSRASRPFSSSVSLSPCACAISIERAQIPSSRERDSVPHRRRLRAAAAAPPAAVAAARLLARLADRSGDRHAHPHLLQRPRAGGG
jgi:hypothetical protein